MRFPRAIGIALLILVPAVMRATHFERSLVPMGALALFCGARFRSRGWAFAIPLASMAVGDVLIGVFHRDLSFGFHRLLPLIYGCYAVSVLLGIALQRYWDHAGSPPERDRGSLPDSQGEFSSPEQRRRRAAWVLGTRVLPIAAGTLGGAVIFFLVTNFGVWYLFDTYAKSWQGLVECYVAAIPYFRQGTLLADCIGAALLFGGDYLLHLVAAGQPETEPSLTDF